MPSLNDFVAHLAATPSAQSALMKQARPLALRHLHRRYPFARSELCEEAWSDTIKDLVEDRITGFRCDHPIAAPAYLQSLSTYLAYQVAPNKLKMHLRKEGKRPLLDDVVATSDADEPALLERLLARAHATSGQGDWTQDHVLQKQLVALLHRCIDGLSAKLRPVIDCLLDEHSHDETRARLGLASVGTVKSRLFAAMGVLRRCMGVHLPHGGPQAGDPPCVTCGSNGDAR